MTTYLRTRERGLPPAGEFHDVGSWLEALPPRTVVLVTDDENSAAFLVEDVLERMGTVVNAKRRRVFGEKGQP